MSSSTDLGVGEALRARRRQRNLALEFVAQETRIQLRFLKALEEEKWDEFPARVYLEGFLKKYAAVLGLDPDELVKRLRESTAPRESEGAPAAPPKNQPRRPPMDDGGDPRQPPLVLFFFLAVVAGIYFYTSHMTKPAPKPAPAAPQAAAPSGEAPAPAAPAAPAHGTASPPPAAPAEAPLPPGSHRFGVQAKSGVSLRCWVDGRLRFEGQMRTGVSRSWVGTKSFRVTAADAGAVDVYADGKLLPPPTSSGAGDFEWPSAGPAEGAPAVEPLSAPAP